MNSTPTLQIPACRRSGGSCSKAGAGGPRSLRPGRCSQPRWRHRLGTRRLTFGVGWRQRWLLCWLAVADNRKNCCRTCFRISGGLPWCKVPLVQGWFSSPGSCKSHAGCSRHQPQANLTTSVLMSMLSSTLLPSTFLSSSSLVRLTCCCFPCRWCSRWCATSGIRRGQESSNNETIIEKIKTIFCSRRKKTD